MLIIIVLFVEFSQAILLKCGFNLFIAAF